MKNIRISCIIGIISWLFILPTLAHAQGTTIIRGRVIDESSGEAISYANVFIKSKTTIGTTTDFEGFYELRFSGSGMDSLKVSQLGYKSKTKAIGDANKQTINFRLEPTSYNMEEVVIKPGKNPSTILLENVWKHEDQNDKRSLKAYEYESYTRTEVSINNLSKKFKEKKILKPFKPIFDSMQIAAGEDGKEVLPVFVSETLSKIYQLNNPSRQKEKIKASKVTGVGLDDGSFISQFVGASFQQYNFYNDWITILNKNFVSPIGHSGPNFYEYYLVDTQVLEGKYCYEVQYKPKREEDLAFKGSFWIHDTTFALKRITAETGGNANLNFIDRFKIQQNLTPTKAGPWLPKKTRVLIDVAEITENSFGMLGKFYISNKEFVINQPKDLRFYEEDIEKAKDYQDYTDTFWENNRHGKLSQMEKKVFKTVDSIRNMPIVKSYVEVAETLVNGYLDLGPVEVGPYILLYGNNVVEGHRFRVGAKTDEDFSEHWIFSGYLAYGTKDRTFKYNLQAETFLSRESWTKVGFQHKYDLEGLGVYDNFFKTNNLFQFSSQIGLVDRFNRVRLNRFWIESDLFKGFSQRAFIVTRDFLPQGDYVFAYQKPNEDQSKDDRYQTTEISFESRYAPEEKTVINGNERVRLRSEKAPVFKLRYTMGLKDLLGGDFDYHKVTLDIEQDLNLGPLGRGHYGITGTKIFDRLPYPLLNILPGNETFIRSNNTYNLMNFYEFVADKSVELSYTQHFDGFLLNRVPLLKNLRWRLVASGKAAFGAYNKQNDKYLPEYNSHQERVTDDFKTLEPTKPYVEVSYGLENILRFIRIEAIHRLTYLDGPNVRPFGVKGSLYFSF